MPRGNKVQSTKRKDGALYEKATKKNNSKAGSQKSFLPEDPSPESSVRCLVSQ